MMQLKNLEMIDSLYDLQVERQLLGALIINNEFLFQVEHLLKPEHFYEVVHQAIYSSLVQIIIANKKPFDLALLELLNNKRLLPKKEMEKYLQNIATSSLMVLEAKPHAVKIQDYALKRELVTITTKTLSLLQNNVFSTAAEYIENISTSLYNLSFSSKEENFIQIKEDVENTIFEINKAMKNPTTTTGIKTGFNTLDKCLLGFQKSDLIILAARPSMGKTAFALNLALNCIQSLAKEKGSVGIISLEMSRDQLTSRMLSILANVSTHKLKNGQLNESEYNMVQQCSAKLKALPLFLSKGNWPMSTICLHAKKLKTKHNLQVLFIDYLQLIKGNKHSNKVHEISEITQSLKHLAQELDISIIALSQLSRAIEQRNDKKPILSDLRESGSIEQDADIVMFLHRDNYYNPTHNLSKCNEKAQIILAKHRNGPTGTINLEFDNECYKFYDQKQI